jgi:hypothetical protein
MNFIRTGSKARFDITPGADKHKTRTADDGQKLHIFFIGKVKQKVKGLELFFKKKVG